MTAQKILADIQKTIATLPPEFQDRVHTWTLTIRNIMKRDDAFIMAMTLAGAELAAKSKES